MNYPAGFVITSSVFAIEFTLVYASAGGVTTVTGRIPFNTSAKRFRATPRGPVEVSFITPAAPTEVLVDSSAPQVVPVRPLVERTRFPAFADPFRGGVYVG
jgi:hypothetical protein